MVSPLLQPTAQAMARAETIAGVVSAIIRVVIWVIAGLTVLSVLGINLGPFVAGATIVGAALGFGAQTLVKDFLSGMLILAEDQYGVGDNIVVGNTTGTVEGVTLRITRIRSLDGVVWYVPNGDIRTVGNNSEGDSVALVEVVVPLGTDLEAAGRAALDEAQRMAAEPEWSTVIVGEPTFAGIASVAADGAKLRVMARTVPGAHWRTGRELLLRLLERLRRDKLAWVTEADPGSAEAGTLPAEPGAEATLPAEPGAEKTPPAEPGAEQTPPAKPGAEAASTGPEAPGGPLAPSAPSDAASPTLGGPRPRTGPPPGGDPRPDAGRAAGDQAGGPSPRSSRQGRRSRFRPRRRRGDPEGGDS